MPLLNVGQVQEKKVKKVCDVNVDPLKTVGNGPVPDCTPTSSKPYLANGECKERPANYLSNDPSFPSGGFPSLHLPVVVVFMLI